MPGNHLWNPTRVKNFMRELELVPTNWEENIVALAEKGRMTVEEFLATDPITFGEKFWGKNTIQTLLGDSTYREMLHYYRNTPAQLAVKAYEDAKVEAIKEQKALGLTTYMGVSAEDATGWDKVFTENYAARAAQARALKAAAAWEELAEQEEAATAEEEAAVEAAWAEMEAEAEAQVAKWAASTPFGGFKAAAAAATPFGGFKAAAADKEAAAEHEKTKWACPTCSAVWRTKTKIQ